MRTKFLFLHMLFGVCATTTVCSQSLKNSEHLGGEWETIATRSPFTTLQYHKERESVSVPPYKAESSCITQCTATYVRLTKTRHSQEGVKQTHRYSEKKTRPTVSLPVVGLDPERGGESSGKFLVLDSNTIYILAAVGGALLIVIVTIILLGVVCLCRSRQRKVEVSGLKRSNTTRSSDFVFNSAYEWTCRQTRLLDHLRPDTTGYQSHWSLTRDISRKGTSLQRNNSQKETSTAPPDTPAKSGTTKCAATSSSKEISDENADAENVCVVLENQIQCEESSDDIEKRENKSHKRDYDHADTDSSSLPHAKHIKQDQETSKGEAGAGMRSSYTNYCSHSAVDMYSNPLYARRRERSKKRRGRENQVCERERSRRKFKEVEEEEEEEKELGGVERKEGERRRERWRESEKPEDPQKAHSTAFYIAPLEPLGSFLLSDSETYDSGNASAVSTDVSSVQLSTTATNQDTASIAPATQQQLLTTDEGGLVESSSFEFANNIGHKPILK